MTVECFWGINWYDSMIVSADHFRGQEQAFERRLGWGLSCALGAHGLAAGGNWLPGGVEWDIQRNNERNKARIEVYR